MVFNFKLIFLSSLLIPCQVSNLNLPNSHIFNNNKEGLDNFSAPSSDNTNDNIIQSTTEIRAYIKNIHRVQGELISLSAIFKSEYAFTDYIYQQKKAKLDLDKEYIRLRVYEKTNWNQKKCILVHKIKTAQGITGTLIVNKGFDSIYQAEQELKHDYILLFFFYRNGWQYSLNDNQIFVENIQYLNPTIEIVGPDKNHIDYLFSKISLDKVIEHSTPYLIQQHKIN